MTYDSNLYNTLLTIEEKFHSLNLELESSTISIARLTEVNKELKKMEKIIEKFKIYKKNIEECKNIETFLATSTDEELNSMMKVEHANLIESLPILEQELKILLLPKDPNDEKNIIIELRPAAGGDEASIFVADLFETYKCYFDRMGWKLQVIDISFNVHGYDYVCANITGQNVYSKMKFESGVHRVQRIPATESKGRVHTSTITVAVMPELDEIDIKLNPADIRTDIFRSGGAGGQHVNKTESAVRLTHIPTGVVVACDSERSQIQNRANAMKMLTAKIYQKLEEERISDMESTRKDQVGTGDRSEKIRTYNYPQNRITDHRIGLSLNKLDYIMQGYLDEIIDALVLDEQSKLLQSLKI